MAKAKKNEAAVAVLEPGEATPETADNQNEALVKKTSADMTIVDRAQYVDQRIREINNHFRTVVQDEFIECGLLLREMEEGQLWAHLVNPKTGDAYQFMGEWMDDAMNYGRSTYMEAKRVVLQLADIPAAKLAEIPRSNYKHMIKLPENIRGKAKWIKAAKLPEKEFVAAIKEEMPDLHVEHKQKVVFALYESQWVVVDKALTKMMKELSAEDGGAPVNKETALEHICDRYNNL